MGPSFSLKVYDTGRSDYRGQTILGYEFKQGKETIFEGSEFAGSPMHADDADATMASLMCFLSLRPGDTDAEYFENYTDRQKQFCREHAEILAWYCAERFGEI